MGSLWVLPERNIQELHSWTGEEGGGVGEGRLGGEVMGVVREHLGLHLFGDQAGDERNSRDLLGPRSDY